MFNFNDINNIDELYNQMISEAQSKLVEKTESDVKIFFPFEDGFYKLRILPSKDLISPFFRVVVSHIVVSENGNKIAKAVCKNKTFGKPCFFCETIGLVKSQNTPEAKKFLSYFREEKRVYVNAIFQGYKKTALENFGDYKPRDIDREYKVGELVLTVLPYSVADAIFRLITINKASNIILPETGRSIIIERNSSTGRVAYTATPEFATNPIPNWDALKEELYDLDEIISSKDVDDRILIGRFVEDTMAQASLIAAAVKHAANTAGIELPEPEEAGYGALPGNISQPQPQPQPQPQTVFVNPQFNQPQPQSQPQSTTQKSDKLREILKGLKEE